MSRALIVALVFLIKTSATAQPAPARWTLLANPTAYGTQVASGLAAHRAGVVDHQKPFF